MTQTLRLTALDEMFITDDIDIVPSVQIEARVSGRFDLDRLAAACAPPSPSTPWLGRGLAAPA